MPSKSLIEKVQEIDKVMMNAQHCIMVCNLEGFKDDYIVNLDYANKRIERLLYSLDMDYELYRILKRFYDYHMREVNLIKLRKDK